MTSAGTAQLNPVSWSFSAEQIKDLEYNLVITANIADGWSVYSQFMDSNQGAIPTSFEFFTNGAIELVGQTTESGFKKDGFDKLFNIRLVKFSKKAKFT